MTVTAVLPPDTTPQDDGDDGRPRKATPIVPADPPRLVQDADPARWRREGPAPAPHGLCCPDPVGEYVTGMMVAASRPKATG